MGKEQGLLEIEVCCGKCKFWENEICRREPPKLYVQHAVALEGGVYSYEYNAMFPATNKFEWCGEFKTIERGENNEKEKSS